MLYPNGMEKQIKLHEGWRIQYRADRYLRDLPEGELFERAGDLMTITLQHSMDGKIAVSPVGEDASKMQRFTHVLEELAIRRIDYRQPGIVEAMRPPKPNSPKVNRALQVLDGRNWPDSILVKFGARKYMAPLFLEGRGRISLAKTYDDPSLGYGRADDESKISVYVHPMDAHRLMALEHKPDGSSRGLDIDVPYLGSVKIDLQATSDFYVYCMAQACDARMFDDFTTAASDVDTCVVVRPTEFRTRIREAIASKLPQWKLVEGPIVYVDPFFGRVHQLAPQFCKHFRFEYQNEFRLLWLPPQPNRSAKLAPTDHIDFELGPLTDCATLIWL
jgi:hypothetical protein